MSQRAAHGLTARVDEQLPTTERAIDDTVSPVAVFGCCNESERRVLAFQLPGHLCSQHIVHAPIAAPVGIAHRELDLRRPDPVTLEHSDQPGRVLYFGVPVLAHVLVQDPNVAPGLRCPGQPTRRTAAPHEKEPDGVSADFSVVDGQRDLHVCARVDCGLVDVGLREASEEAVKRDAVPRTPDALVVLPGRRLHRLEPRPYLLVRVPRARLTRERRDVLTPRAPVGLDDLTQPIHRPAHRGKRNPTPAAPGHEARQRLEVDMRGRRLVEDCEVELVPSVRRRVVLIAAELDKTAVPKPNRRLIPPSAGRVIARAMQVRCKEFREVPADDVLDLAA